MRAGSAGSWRLWNSRLRQGYGGQGTYDRQSGAEAGRRSGQGGRHRDHAPVGELLAVVPGRRAPRGAGGLHRGQGLHGHPAVRLRHLGADPAGVRQAVQGDRPRQRVLSAVHPGQPAEQGEGARRGLHAAGRLGHQGRRRGARRAARDPSDLGSDHRHVLRQVDQVVARSARPHQPVGERRPLGKGDAAVPADDRVPLAGRAHRARDRRRSPGRDAEDPRALQGVRRNRARDARRRRPEEREREVRRRVAHLFDRGADGRRPRAPGRARRTTSGRTSPRRSASSSRGATRRSSTRGRRRGACRRG